MLPFYFSPDRTNCYSIRFRAEFNAGWGRIDFNCVKKFVHSTIVDFCNIWNINSASVVSPIWAVVARCN